MAQPQKRDRPARADALQNRERILAVALAELTVSADVPLSAIARKAGVGQGTFYRHWADGGVGGGSPANGATCNTSW